jgi:hypothetical protein
MTVPSGQVQVFRIRRHIFVSIDTNIKARQLVDVHDFCYSRHINKETPGTGVFSIVGRDYVIDRSTDRTQAARPAQDLRPGRRIEARDGDLLDQGIRRLFDE